MKKLKRSNPLASIRLDLNNKLVFTSKTRRLKVIICKKKNLFYFKHILKTSQTMQLVPPQILKCKTESNPRFIKYCMKNESNRVSMNLISKIAPKYHFTNHRPRLLQFKTNKPIPFVPEIARYHCRNLQSNE